ncbi:hypothetical protein Zmor_016774 [Zophobas morio]|uniref:Chitin deacetylase n=1 Tax=Zophobas morio TaxID=2755281 RepID=A0AA38MC75_9CUCU|nr:hypothetical protein Zmor_016774 [Zophobas morio]
MKVVLVCLVGVFATLVAFTSGELAQICLPPVPFCLLENNCVCTSKKSPIPTEETPQLISLTFSESVTDDLYTNLWAPLLLGRTNPDGAPISATFFVPHEYTDYRRVHDLYANGFEIGVNSITSNYSELYWATASVDTLVQEFDGQRTIISHFATIPGEDIVGVRTPQLQLQGDVSIDAFVAAGFEYDSSWSSTSLDPYFPYTLDYLSHQECRLGTTCPIQSHPGFWVAPIIDRRRYTDRSWVDCNNLSTCYVNGTSDEIAEWLLRGIEQERSGNRAPITLIVPSDWFRMIYNSYLGFAKFLDTVGTMDDVFLVNLKQVVDWAKNPVPLSEFKTAVTTPETECHRNTCKLRTAAGEVRYLTLCVRDGGGYCPDVYPWLGNPLGEIQKEA